MVHKIMYKWFTCAAIITILTLNYRVESKEVLPPPCNSDIYCHGPLLDTIQMAKIYEDSKTFVDMKMRYSPNETLSKFSQFMTRFDNKPTRLDVKQFVIETFEPEGQEFEEWEPSDWKAYPKFLENIRDESFRKWAFRLNQLWKFLGRKMKAEVESHQDQYSIIWVPNPVIVPGGRFREFYYWDSYWIVQGLMLSEMHSTVKGMLENFLYIVDNYGHIPNGGRIYYLARSQPPLLIPTVKLYYDYTKDVGFIKKHIHTMEKEFNFWLNNHTVDVNHDDKVYKLAVYGDKSNGPRPESYSEDVDGAAIFPDDANKEEFYSELKAAAESGWDFSSRWFITNATNKGEIFEINNVGYSENGKPDLKGNLTNIKTRSIVPVDLNAMLYWNAVLLSEFHTILNNKEKAQYYQDISEQWLEAVQAVLWHEESGIWLDYDRINEIKRDYFYPSNVAPLWAGCYNKSDTDRIVRNVLKYLQNKNIVYPGGIPSTVEHTGEQWDYPNAWPPLQHMIIIGLNNTGDEAAQRLAFEIAERWVVANYKAFNKTEAMFEKYDATVPGGYGGGGEYEVQLGFGWTNGVIMELLNSYGKVLHSQHDDNEKEQLKSSSPSNPHKMGQISTVILALLVSLTAGLIAILIYKKRPLQNNAQETAKTKSQENNTKYARLKNNSLKSAKKS